MQIAFNPRITSQFAELILKSERVQEAMHSIDSYEERKEIVRQVLIEGFTKYKIDINDLINYLKDNS